MRIIRVFPRKTSYTPDDDYCFFDLPPFPDLLPPHDEVHISCAMTWDRPRARELAYQWEMATDKPVKLGGPAFHSPVTEFVQGRYLKPNIIFTTRGCNNACPWCIVPKLEGKLTQYESIPVGNIIQDNNFLQTDRKHKDKVFEMLKTQRRISFKGGLEPDLIDDHFVENVRNLRIDELWLACDTDARFPLFAAGCEKLTKAGFNREKIFCYVLSYGKDMDADAERAKAVFEAGAMPFMQLYRDFSETKTEYSKEWEQFARGWQRPAIIKAKMKEEA
jgi:hypothetical protein